ncbi:unnamed protein product [Toxocara canis]|uniref:DHC_N1 domain-containing protein n=1 Tax=Toxocara canis TaxID=6265 RepID=A0A183VD15_TOXCA|nr:unnamed protein product [Toxocara canis]
MLTAVLEEAIQQWRVLLERAERIFTAIAPTASPVSVAEFVTSSLSTGLLEFTYDLDKCSTFGVCFNRIEDVIAKVGSTLDEAARARLIAMKLNAAAYTLFTNHILLKRASELCFDVTVKAPKELFGHSTSVFARR